MEEVYINIWDVIYCDRAVILNHQYSINILNFFSNFPRISIDLYMYEKQICSTSCHGFVMISVNVKCWTYILG